MRFKIEPIRYIYWEETKENLDQRERTLANKVTIWVETILIVWFVQFTSTIQQYKSKQAHTNHTFFRRHAGKIIIIIVYVDNIVLIGDEKIKLDNIKRRFARDFEMKDLGNLRYFLGMEVAWNLNFSNKCIFKISKKWAW